MKAPHWVILVAIVSLSLTSLSHECYELPVIRDDIVRHKKSNNGRVFLRQHNINSVPELEDGLRRLSKKTLGDWQNVGNLYRHEQHGLACAKLIYLAIATQKRLRPRDRSFAYIALSKIAEREGNVDDSALHAENAIITDHNNGYAWLRCGNIFHDVDRQEECHKHALVIARDTGDVYLRARGYFGLSQIARYFERWPREQRYLFLAHKAAPHDRAIQRRYERVTP